MTKKDSDFIKQAKELEKLNNRISNRTNWLTTPISDFSEQARLVIQMYDEVESMLAETIFKYYEIIRNLDIEAMVDDE